MTSIDEKRVYADRAGRETVLVASSAGLATVSVSDGLVGEFGLVHRCDARDVATRAGRAAGASADQQGRVAVATNEDVLLGPVDDLEPAGFGPAVAVGVDGDHVLAGDADGRLGSQPHAASGGDWVDLGRVDGPVHAIDGDLVAADGGVYRVVGNDGGERSLQHAGLAAVRDVSAVGVPLAATADGLYRLGNGWMDALDGDVRTVAADPATAQPGRLGLAHAATDDALFEYRDGDWESVPLPVEESVVGVAYGEATYAVTADGTFLADASEGWRSRTLGLPDVGGVAVI